MTNDKCFFYKDQNAHCCFCRGLPQSNHSEPHRYWSVKYANTLSSWPEGSASVSWGPDNITVDSVMHMDGVTGQGEAYLDIATGVIETKVFTLDVNVQDAPSNRYAGSQSAHVASFVFCSDRWCCIWRLPTHVLQISPKTPCCEHMQNCGRCKAPQLLSMRTLVATLASPQMERETTL